MLGASAALDSGVWPGTVISRLLRVPDKRGTLENVAPRTPGIAASRSEIRAWTAANWSGV